MPDQDMNFDDHLPEEELMAREDDWLKARYPAVSSDFVDDTLARVLADRQEIDLEAARVEEVQFEPQFLAHLDVPEPSPDFVEETLAKVVAQRHGRDTSDQALRELIHHYRVPQTSPNFVPRTLDALGLRDTRSSTTMFRRALQWSAAAALLVVLPLVAFIWWSGSQPVVPYPTADALSTGRWGAAMADPFSRRTGEMPRIRLRDAELTMAHLATRKLSRGE